MIAKGVLTEVDAGTLAAYCEAYALWVDAKKVVSLQGMTIQNAQGVEIVSPYVRIVNTTVQQMVKLASELGITPASRSRVTAETDDGERSLEDELYGDGESDVNDEQSETGGNAR